MKTNENQNTLPLKKERSDSTWNGLTPEKREKLEGWLFEEGLSYREVLKRAPKELGVTASLGSLSRYYNRVLKMRVVTQLNESRSAANAVAGAGIKLEKLRNSALTVIGSRLLEQAMQHGDVNELATLGKLLSDAEKRQIQRERLALSRERFQFNAAEAALEQMSHVEGMSESDLKLERERVRGIIRRLFGKELPK